MPSSHGPATAPDGLKNSAAAIRPPITTALRMGTPASASTQIFTRSEISAPRGIGGNWGWMHPGNWLQLSGRRLDKRLGTGNDLLLRSTGAGRPGHDRRHQDQCRARQRLDLPKAPYFLQA